MFEVICQSKNIDKSRVVILLQGPRAKWNYGLMYCQDTGFRELGSEAKGRAYELLVL